MSDEYANVFKEETYEILEELEKTLLILEADPDDGETIAKIFRGIHTIKGSGAMFGFDMISAFAHEIENTFDLIREGTLKANKSIIDLTLRGVDFIKKNLETEKLDENSLAEKEEIVKQFLQVVEKAKSGHVETMPPNLPMNAPKLPASPQPEISLTLQEPEPSRSEEREPAFSSAKSNVSADETTYRIRFKPGPSLLEKGADISELLREIHALGPCHIIAHLSNVPLLADIVPNRCYISWDIILTTQHAKNAIRDIFIFVEDDAELQIQRIDSNDSLNMPDYKTIGNILLEKGDISQEEINDILQSKKKIGQILVEEGIVPPESVESALLEQQHVREIRHKRQETETTSSLRVSAEKVDILVNLVGELVTLQARLAQLSHQRNDTELISLAEEVERITWELRDNSMDMRMLPIGSTFSRFKRLVRDLSGTLGKEVELTTEGGDTELDKSVIEKLNDPLVHIIRNSIDHGIELPEIRTAAGKGREGNIHLQAYHAGYNVVIRITDNGAGLDTEKIRTKAIEKGIIPPDKEISQKEIFNLIFEPGFSTAQIVSDVSGRGVGMDVVKRNIESLRGFVDVESQKGKGTTFTLKIPLTLAIIDGLLVSIGTDKFVLPLSVVESCIEIYHDKIAGAARQYVNVRGELIPYIYLREDFAITTPPPPIELIVITSIDNMRVGFVVDHVIGDHQTVIKSLGRVYKEIEGISGATILGDGTVALILDITKLVQKAIADADFSAMKTLTATS